MDATTDSSSPSPWITTFSPPNASCDSSVQHSPPAGRPRRAAAIKKSRWLGSAPRCFICLERGLLKAGCTWAKAEPHNSLFFSFFFPFFWHFESSLQNNFIFKGTHKVITVHSRKISWSKIHLPLTYLHQTLCSRPHFWCSHPRKKKSVFIFIPLTSSHVSKVSPHFSSSISRMMFKRSMSGFKKEVCFIDWKTKTAAQRWYESTLLLQ